MVSRNSLSRDPYWIVSYSARTHLVSLVVVLRVELENLGLLWVFESGRQIISAEFLAPLLSVDEPKSGQKNTLD